VALEVVAEAVGLALLALLAAQAVHLEVVEVAVE
jgi:hypothetical protein